MVTVEDVQEALSNVIDPELGLDFVELGLIYDIEIDAKASAKFLKPEIAEPLRALAADLPISEESTGEQLGRHPAVRETVLEGLRRMARDSGTSQRAARAVILSGAPSLEAGEITDKGYVNQRAVLTLRADDVQRLFSNVDSVIVIE